MASLDLLTPHLSKIKIAGPQQLVYKDECVYSFDNPVSCTFYYNLHSYFVNNIEFIFDILYYLHFQYFGDYSEHKFTFLINDLVLLLFYVNHFISDLIS